MPVLYLVYADSKNERLPHLRKEAEKTYDSLLSRAKKNHFIVHQDKSPSRDSIIKYLKSHSDELIVFSFSGHAGKDQLLLDDEEAKAGGVAGLLKKCSSLKLILLNGCSTAEQTERLLNLPSRPVVVVTHAPIGDAGAAQFGSVFFEVMAEGGNIKEAFEAGLEEARIISNIAVKRGIRRRVKADEFKNAWGIYGGEGASLDYKLPVETSKENEARLTLSWLKWWSAHILVGIGALLLTLILQIEVSENSPLPGLIPIYYFFTPFTPTLRTPLPEKRFYLLIAFHAAFYFLLFFKWISSVNYNLLFSILGLIVYFFILPKLNDR